MSTKRRAPDSRKSETDGGYQGPVMPKPIERIHERSSTIFALSDDQWQEIAKFSAMPNDARQEIENVIGNYRRFQRIDSFRMPPAKTRDNLKALRNGTLALLDRLSPVMGDPEAHFALTVAEQPQGHKEALSRTTRRDAHQRLDRAKAELEHLANWFEIASHRVDKTKRGPNTANAYWLVKMLDVVREKFTGKRISRSYKDGLSKNYIEAACNVADRAIGSGTIERAMMDRIKRRGTN